MSDVMNEELEALLTQLENVSTDEETPSSSPSITPNPSPRVAPPSVSQPTPTAAITSNPTRPVEAKPQFIQMQPASIVHAGQPARSVPTTTQSAINRTIPPRRDEDDDFGSLLTGFKGGVQSISAHATAQRPPEPTKVGKDWEGKIYRSPFEEEFLRAQQAATEELAIRERREQEQRERREAEKASRQIDTSGGCGGCGMSVSGSFLQALGKEWHTACFVCHQCREALTGPTARGGGKFFEHANQPYCDRCYRIAAKQK